MKTSIFVIVMVILFIALNIIYFSPGQFTFIDANPKPTIIPLSDSKSTTESKVTIDDEKIGSGEVAKTGNTVTVNYKGTLIDGKEFDSSYKRNEPFTFKLGSGEVIKGWDQGIVGMKVGGKRKLTIPSDLGYGAAGAPPSIPANATLVFEVELVKVQ